MQYKNYSIKRMLKDYLELRKDTGESGFWSNPKGTKQTSPKCINDMAEKLKQLEKEVLNCRKCELGKYRLNPCFGRGDPKTKIMFIGEGPGYEEDHTGIVFVGRAGKLLDTIIEQILKDKAAKFYITNIVKCHPMKEPAKPDKRGNDRPPTHEEIQKCMAYLIRQINLIKPQIIITLGSPATKTILNTDQGITALRGKIFDINIGNIKVKVVPTYHPAYLLRSPSKKSELLKDIKIIRTLF
jgi:DNA polymerase